MSASTDQQFKHLSALHGPNPYDTFLSGDDLDEQLRPVEASLSPSSHHSSSPPTKTEYLDSQSPSSFPHDSNHFHQTNTSLYNSNGFHLPSEYSPSHQELGTNTSFDWLSPDYLSSETGYYGESENDGTPDMGNDLYYNDTTLSSETPNKDRPPQLGRPSEESIKSQGSQYTQRASSGAATYVTRLMSPELTDAASLASKSVSPTMDPKQLERAGSYSAQSPENAGQMPMSVPMQLTPALSSGASPPRPHTPTVKVERISRGDSPARVIGIRRSASKRSRSSSHLAVEHDDSSDEDESQDVVRSGVEPQARPDMSVEVPNFKDQEVAADLAEKAENIQGWLAHSQTGSEIDPNENTTTTNLPGRRKKSSTKNRLRARSAGDATLSRANLEKIASHPVADLGIPGPGELLEESEGEDDSEDDGETLPDSLPAAPEDEAIRNVTGAREEELPFQPPLYKSKVWDDPLHDPTPVNVRTQPGTSNAAIEAFRSRANDIETISRVATWGTRRVSESDLAGLFNTFTFSEKHGRAEHEKPERRGTFFRHAAGLLPKRSASLLRRKDSDNSKQKQGVPQPQLSKRDSLGLSVLKSSQRRPSLSSKKSRPRLNTVSAITAMTGVATLGAGSGSATTPSSPWNSQGSIGRPGIADLLGRHGGPPLPTLATPRSTDVAAPTGPNADLEDDDEDEAMEDRGVKIDFSVPTDPIVPTFDGFRTHVRRINPRLPSWLVDRISCECLKRFKKLLDFKLKHLQSISQGKCASGKHCTALNGEPTYLPSRSSNKEAENLNAGLSVTGFGQSAEDENALAEGVITPAQFPAGVPMPPVSRLPAEFECPICYRPKKVLKPSDYSKHTQEDVQPFTCTFEKCPEPKSFKRKADWVRHENERHRRLETWTCNQNECNHQCYRRDNFLQHLLREHKLPEPSTKSLKSKASVRGPSSQKNPTTKVPDDGERPSEVWDLVEKCRQESTQDPRTEPCKFCGNICNTWKKLTVHLAKHMEQISMPILALVEKFPVTTDTIISPVDQQRLGQQSSMSPIEQSQYAQHPLPYGMPGSFVPVHGQGAYSMANPGVDQRAVNRTSMSYPPQVPSQETARYAQVHGSPYGMNKALYADGGGSSNPPFLPINAQRGFSQPPATSSPELIYGNVMPVPSQPRPTPYVEEDDYTHQTYTSPTETSGAYGFPANPHTSYPQQQPLAADVQMPLQYNVGPIPFTQAHDPSMYQQGYHFQQ